MNNDNIRYTEAKDKAGLKDMVGKAIASYGNARIAVQVAIIAILCHAAKHHDYSQANALIAGLGGKTGRDVVTFFRDFGGLKTEPAEDGSKPEGFSGWEGSEYIAVHLEEAKATMYWQHKQPKGDIFREYTLEDMAREFLNRHAKAVKAAAKGNATLDDSISEVTMKAVLNLVKFEKVAAKAADSQAKAV